MDKIFFLVNYIIILSVIGCRADNSEIIPVRILPDDQEYCVHELFFIDDHDGFVVDDTVLLMNKLIAISEDQGGYIIYFDWVYGKKAELLYPEQCRNAPHENSYLAMFSDNASMSLVNIQRDESSPRVMHESEAAQIRDAKDVFGFQSEYQIKDCALQVEFPFEKEDWSEVLDFVEIKSRPIIEGRLIYAFPFLMSVLFNDKVYLLFSERCDEKEIIFNNIIHFISSMEGDSEYSNITYMPVIESELIKDVFFIR